MRPLSIRASVSAWFALLTTILLLGFTGALWAGMRSTLMDGLDAELSARVDWLVSHTEWEEDIGGPLLDLPPEQIDVLLAEDPDRGRELWVLPSGDLLHRSGPEIVPALELASLPAAGEPAVFETVANDGAEALRVCTRVAHVVAFADDDEDFYGPGFDVALRVSQPTASVDEQLAGMVWFVLPLAGLALVVVLGFGAFLSRRFVGPVADLSAAAAEVRSGRRAEMPRRGTDDELDQLAGVLDESFDALRASLDRQTRFTSDAAHELRNPISVIQSAAEVALRRERSPAEYDAFLWDVLLTAKRMGAIVEALLLLARMDAGTAEASFEDIDLSALANDSVAAQQDPARGRICLLNGRAPVVRGDAGLLRVLLDNLLSNALRYSDDGAPVDVVVGAEDGGPTTLTVRDYGNGVTAEQAERMFERFYRGENGHPERGGAGLGLSIVAAVAQLHGAECDAEPLERGTRFRVRFPR